MKITGNKWGKYGCKFSIYKNIFSTIFFANFGGNQNLNWVRLPKIELGQVRFAKNRKNERDESKNGKKS